MRHYECAYKTQSWWSIRHIRLYPGKFKAEQVTGEQDGDKEVVKRKVERLLQQDLSVH